MKKLLVLFMLVGLSAPMFAKYQATDKAQEFQHQLAVDKGMAKDSAPLEK